MPRSEPGHQARRWHTLTELPSGSSRHSTLNRVEGQAMSNIIKFPKEFKGKETAAKVVPTAAPAEIKHQACGSALLAGLVKAVWLVVVLIWPILKWVLSIITFFQLVRMFYYWNTPGVYAGWSFIGYFVVLTAVTYFVSIYKPKGI